MKYKPGMLVKWYCHLYNVYVIYQRESNFIKLKQTYVKANKQHERPTLEIF